MSVLDGMPDAEALASHLSILSDPRRLRILFCIHAHPGMRSTDIAAAIDANPSTTSHALAVLREAGWVRAERHGREIRYHLQDPLAHEILHRVGAHHGHRETDAVQDPDLGSRSGHGVP